MAFSFSPSRLAYFVAVACVSMASASQAAVITVNSNADTTGGANCTLRDAINSANTNTAVGGRVAGDPTPTVDNIQFNIPGLGVHTIVLASQLPYITEPVNT